MSKQETTRDEPLFSKALTLNAKDNYLGNARTVRNLLLTTISDGIEKYSKVRDENRPAALRNICRGLATVLIGKDPDYGALHKWNEPGAIDEFLVKWFGYGEIDPLQRVEHAALDFFSEVLAVADYAGEDGVLDEQWKPLMEELVSRWADIFMGIDPPSHAAIDPEEQGIDYVEEQAE